MTEAMRALKAAAGGHTWPRRNTRGAQTCARLHGAGAPPAATAQQGTNRAHSVTDVSKGPKGGKGHDIFSFARPSQ